MKRKRTPDKNETQPKKKQKVVKGETSSLKAIASQFVGICKDSETGIVDLKVSTERLGIKKRRIYDITNVLEGIGLLKKTNKNFVKWVGTQNSASKGETEDIKREIDEENVNMKAVETQLTIKRTELYNLKLDKRAFVTFQELAKVFEMKNRQLVTIKIPFGTQCMLPHGQAGKFPLYLKSKPKSDPMKVFVMNEEKIQARNNIEYSSKEERERQLEDLVNTVPKPKI